MRLKISNDLVLRNVECFKLYLKRYAETVSKEECSIDIIIQAFVQTHSGQLVFMPPSNPQESNNFWQKITFHFFIVGDKKSKACIEIQKGDGQLALENFDSKVAFVLTETIKTMQTITRILPSSHRVSNLLIDYSNVQLELVEQTSLHTDIIHTAWHQMSRKDAERALQSREVGTFLFRKDEYATMLENQLCRAHKTEIKCVNLTYVDLHSKVCEYTLIKTYYGWLAYKGDPSLDEPIFPTIDAFLDNMKGVFKQPLLHV